jgi:hypothetical protein
VVGYAAGAASGYGLVLALSSNAHDRALEAAMTGAFVAGPLGSLLLAAGGFVLAGRGRR